MSAERICGRCGANPVAPGQGKKVCEQCRMSCQKCGRPIRGTVKDWRGNVVPAFLCGGSWCAQGRWGLCSRCGERPREDQGRQGRGLCEVCATQCVRCKATIPHRRAKAKKSSHESLCTKCQTEDAMRWQRAHPEETRIRQRRVNLSRWNITPERWDEMLAEQGGGCAACGATVPGGKGRFHVDHDHACCPGNRSCGACIRGLLCHGCNILAQDVERLRRIVAYLDRTGGVS